MAKESKRIRKNKKLQDQNYVFLNGRGLLMFADDEQISQFFKKLHLGEMIKNPDTVAMCRFPFSETIYNLTDLITSLPPPKVNLFVELDPDDEREDWNIDYK